MNQHSRPPFVLFQRMGTRNWSMRYSIKGKQVRKSLQTDDRAEAERRAYEIWGEANYRAKAGLTANAMPFSKVAEEFIALITEQSERGERSPYHVKDWPPIIRRYLVGYFGDRPADQIVDADIERYLEWRRQYWITGPGKDIPYLHYERNGIRLRRRPSRDIPSISRQRGELVVVRALFEQAAKWGYLHPVTVGTIRVRKRIDNRRPSFEPHEYQKLIETSLSRLVDPIMLTDTPMEITAKDGRKWRRTKLDEHTRRDRIALHCYVEISALTGMRPTEARNLNWGDVLGYRDERKKPIGERDFRLRVRGKGKSGTLIPQLAALSCFDTLWRIFEQELDREPTDDDPVFADAQGNRIQSFKKGFNELLKASGLEYDHRGIRRTPYSLRHFHVSQQLAHGVPIHDLARNTRTSIAMIDKHYAQVTVERMKDSLRPEWSS